MARSLSCLLSLTGRRLREEINLLSSPNVTSAFVAKMCIIDYLSFRDFIVLAWNNIFTPDFDRDFRQSTIYGTESLTCWRREEH